MGVWEHVSSSLHKRSETRAGSVGKKKGKRKKNIYKQKSGLLELHLWLSNLDSVSSKSQS